MNKILIVDDDVPIQILYADELTEEGYEVIATGDGVGLLGLIEEAQPDVVVLDIRLGESNGLDLLQDIRNTYYELPVILCSAYSAFKYDLKSIAADYFVVKSSGLSELKVKIKMTLETRTQLLTGPMTKDAQEIAGYLQNALLGSPRSPILDRMHASRYYSGDQISQYRHSGKSRNPDGYWMPVEDPVLIGDQVRHD